MASVALHRIETHSLEETGEAVEVIQGASPTASSSSAADSLEFYSGHGEQRAQLQRRRGVFRWIVRSLNTLQNKEHEQGHGGTLPSGGSYDSLCGLSESSDGCSEWWDQQQQYRNQPEQQQLQQQHSGLQNSESSSTASAAAPREGFLRRMVKAVLRPVVRAVTGLLANAGPQGPGSNDNSTAERIINVVTSIPFFIIGAYGLRRRRCPKGRHFSLAFMAVGVVAASYHGASISSPIRPLFRKLDYYTICYTSNVLRRAAHISLPSAVQLAALLVAPVKPTAVTGLNLALVESKFLRHALQHAHLRSSFKLHLGTALVGMGCFAYEDIANSMCWPPMLHSLWHCLSALAMGCTNSLLQHLEVALLLEGVQVQAA